MVNKIARWYFSKRALPYWGVVILDSFIVSVAIVLVAALTDGTVTTVLHWKNIGMDILWVLACYLVGFRMLHTYAGVIRYSSFVDLQRVAFANAIGLLLSFIVRMFMTDVVLGYIDLWMVFMMATLGMWMLRVVVKYLYETGVTSGRAKRVFIYGVKKGGISLAKSIRNEEKKKYIVAGFITDDPN